MTWRLLNEIVSEKSLKQNLPIVFKSGNQELSDPAQIVEQFCRYFTNIDKSIFSNYRPISVLPSFSKILEKLVYNRLIDYLSKYKILAFR